MKVLRVVVIVMERMIRRTRIVRFKIMLALRKVRILFSVILICLMDQIRKIVITIRINYQKMEGLLEVQGRKYKVILIVIESSILKNLCRLLTNKW